MPCARPFAPRTRSARRSAALKPRQRVCLRRRRVCGSALSLKCYAFTELVKHHQKHGQAFSCARSAKVVFANEDLHELDVISLPQGQSPICIECKSGEFRRDIDKYLRLHKRLGRAQKRLIVCAGDLSDEQASGLTAMDELTFVNLQSLGTHLQTLA